MNKRALAILGAIVLSGLAAPAAAQQPPPTPKPPPVLGFYLGAGLGGAVLPFDDDDFLPVPGTQNEVTKEEGSFAFKAFIGYRFHQHFALEAYYADFGDFDFQRNVTAPVGGTVRADVKSSGWGIDGLGIFPLSQQWSLFGKLGGFYSTTKTTLTSSGQVSFVAGTNLNPERKEWNFKIGFGGQYDINRHFAVRAEIESCINVGDDQTGEGTISMLSISMVGRF
jgi:OOP family OmpA-OmpF porin